MAAVDTYAVSLATDGPTAARCYDAVEQAIRLHAAEAVVTVLEAVGCSGCCACDGVVCDGPCPRTCSACSALAAWKAEVARLQAEVKEDA